MLTTFNNAKIAYKIGAAFMLVLAAFSVFAYFSMRSLATIEHGTDEIYNNYFASALNLTSAEAALAALFISQKSHIIAPDDNAMLQAEAEVADAVARFDARMAAFQNTLDAGLETETFNSLMARVAKLLELNEQIIALSRNNNDVRAANISAQEFAPLYAEIVQMSETMLQTNVDGAQEYYDRTLNTYNLIMTSFVIAIAVFLGFSLLVGGVVARSVARPLNSLNHVLRRMVEGDAAIDQTLVSRKDEIGDLSQSVVALKAAIEERARDAASEREVAAREASHVVTQLSASIGLLADGELAAEISDPFADQYEALRGDFNALVERLSGTIEAVVEVASSIQQGSGEITQASFELSKRTESQAATLEETAAAMDELTTSVSSSAAGAKGVSSTMETARGQAETTSKTVDDAVRAMTEIEHSSGQISQIIGVIDDIAFQTNLLALNAGVEAARAGDAGRGFAVVASEVRALAQRSSESAAEIKTLVAESFQQVERGVDLVGKTGVAISDIVEQVNQVSMLIRDISEGTAEQARGLAEINSGTAQLDQVTQSNAAMVEEATAASQTLDNDARRLAQLVAFFNVNRRMSGLEQKRAA
ncbi:methyl-accepting chemotaxis protein [Shimia marina]|uniref:Ribose and galactose chemoreceptor protein n=1 Tax=Shimia marina TaxID=321267 RepID=A0A0P1EJ72_9RHOB|nr:HAMP domain-containing methyl-accepting chemotaxis protein [Shimia marina]CUH50584.1 Ribose and galactose chemoreceptor protein [Shimia marina]SFE39761.1 methyl-accepting chemotaxis protein [Shimia marina]